MFNVDEQIAGLREPALRAYRAMVMARTFESKISALYKAGKIMGGVFLGRGHEAIAASEGVFLQRGRDVYTPFIREQAGRCAWGYPVLESARAYFGSACGRMKGRDGNVHWGFPEEGNPAPISHLGSGIAVVAGCMLAKRMKGETGCVGVACYGDGTTSTGAFHEAANLIAVEKLPVIIVVSNNRFAYSTPNEHEFACASLLDRGKGYGIATHECNGTNLLETLAVMKAAIENARRGKGPQWVLANTLRMCGHGEHDDASYIPAALKANFPDPLEVARSQMLEQGWMTESEIEELAGACAREVQTAVAQAQKEPGPDPYGEWCATSWNPCY